MTGILIIVLVLAALCFWQMFAGLAKLRTARANREDLRAATYSKVGLIQALFGGGALIVNIVLNLPALKALM